LEYFLTFLNLLKWHQKELKDIIEHLPDFLN